MVESLQMFLFLFKSKYRRKCSWFSPFLCVVIIVLLLCIGALSKCSDLNCVNGLCKNESCECFEGWQGPECQYCGGKVKLINLSGVITDGPGNYSVSTQCSWLISPPTVGPTRPTLRVRLESFATECGWDHLYIYDGDSVRAEKLLAVFSGVLDSDESSWTRQVIARSGSALLHFFSDDAYSMEGFNLTYAAYSCPSNDHQTNCSNHGECEDGSCRCEPQWTGAACDRLVCPDDCNAEYGGGECTPQGCVCYAGWRGEGCDRGVGMAGWRWGWREPGDGGDGGDRAPPPAAGMSLLAREGVLWRVGGESYANTSFLYKYKVSQGSWEAVQSTNEPAARFLHSAALHGSTLIVFGGRVASDDPERGGGLAGLEGRSGEVTNEVWTVDLDSSKPTWVNATPTVCSHKPAPLKHCGGLHISGHTAVVVYLGPTRKPVMLVFFGHSPHYGYLHIVQEYHIEENVWVGVSPRGWAARGGFGHSAVWDPLSRRVLVHGGLVSASEATQVPSSSLYSYEPERRIWRPLPAAPTPRYLHTAVFVSPGMMLVSGGNAHNDTAAAAAAAPAPAARCYDHTPLIYDVRCRIWRLAPRVSGAARAAAAAAQRVGRPTSALIHGGFDGRLRSDALLFESGAECSTYTSAAACLRAAHTAAVSCVWRETDLKCIALEDIGYEESFGESLKVCEIEPLFVDPRRCSQAESCGACRAAGCTWCGACYVADTYCARHTRQSARLSIEECTNDAESVREACGRYHSCAACHAHHHHHTHGTEELSQRACFWDYDTVKCRPVNSTDDLRGAATSASAGCSAPCATYQACGNCTAEECIWCASAGRCVDKNAYGASFPLGGCRAWSTSGGASTCGWGGGCARHVSCSACRAEPACGWCDDGSGTGRGQCLPGGARLPHAPHHCDPDRWHFTSCDRCQCNGHAVCDEEARCVAPCGGRALGPRCEICAPGHWGSSLNGGECQPCECNAQAVACAPETGRCYCSVKGLAGDRCDKCDNTNHYHADVYNKGACYYDLAVDYQFTFNLSKKEDRHLSAINFRNAPIKADVDADFSITCSAHARMNLTVRSRADPAERTLFSDVNCTNFRYKFAKSEHAFGVEDNVTLTTFFVYVYDFRPPLWIQISFSQYPKLNLQQFFITFSSCFLLLLLVAAALWKIKQKYDMYRRRQRLFVEMEQMASRPFSQVCVELERGNGTAGVPAPVALEPCLTGRAAVLSLLVRLPTGGSGRAPPLGGLQVGSALVTLGHHHAPPPAKRPRAL